MLSNQHSAKNQCNNHQFDYEISWIHWVCSTYIWLAVSHFHIINHSILFQYINYITVFKWDCSILFLANVWLFVCLNDCYLNKYKLTYLECCQIWELTLKDVWKSNHTYFTVIEFKLIQFRSFTLWEWLTTFIIHFGMN